MKVHVVGSNHHIISMWRDKGYELVKAVKEADIISFVGGADINPVLYHERPLPRTQISYNTDKRDIDAWNESTPKQMRVGICRGGQFLNVMNGGALWQHVDNHATYAGHEIQDVLFKRKLKVTSTHHQMMIPTDKGEVLAFAEGLATGHSTAKPGGRAIPKFDTEVVWYEDTNSLCFQPHPEWDQHPDTRTYFFDLITTLRP